MQGQFQFYILSLLKNGTRLQKQLICPMIENHSFIKQQIITLNYTKEIFLDE